MAPAMVHSYSLAEWEASLERALKRERKAAATGQTNVFKEPACGAECPEDAAGSARSSIGFVATAGPEAPTAVAVPGCGAAAQVAVPGCGAAARTPVPSVVKRDVEPHVNPAVQTVNPGAEEEHRVAQRAVVERFTDRTTEKEGGPMFMSLHFVCQNRNDGNAGAKCWSVSELLPRWYCPCCGSKYKTSHGLLIQVPKRWTYAGLLRSRALHDPGMPRGSHVDPL